MEMRKTFYGDRKLMETRERLLRRIETIRKWRKDLYGDRKPYEMEKDVPCDRNIRRWRERFLWR